MTTAANRDIAIAFVERMTGATIDESLLTDDATWWVPGYGDISKQALIDMLAGFVKLVEGGKMKVTVLGVTAEGDRVAIEAESHGKMKNGKIYNNTYHFLLLLRDGKIHKVKEYNDTAYVASVLGQ